jgi:hypothetical protein
MYNMDLKTLIETVAPTKMGWVLDAQSDSELKSNLEFRGQLMALSRGCGTGNSVTPQALTLE